jgi:CheY-like chemotaxis protein/predicted regulator of Ras-like GTPase activity (Roadblock/LC7/MglB family)
LSQLVLVVDPDTGFAALLKEGLEQTKAYQVVTVHDGQAALDALARDRFAMVILDLGLTDPPAAQIAQSIRTQQPQVPLMIIPLDGDTVPPEIGAFGVHGVLPKPFFLPDLPEMVAQAMQARPVTTSVPAPEAEQPEVSSAALLRPESSSVELWQRNEAELTAQLSSLAHELNADAVLLTCGNDLVTHTGRFARPEAEQLARVIIESWHASAKVPQLLGREKVRFEQSMHQSGDYLLYSLSVTEDTVLTVALDASTPLGIIRYNTKQTAEAIGKMLQ